MKYADWIAYEISLVRNRIQSEPGVELCHVRTFSHEMHEGDTKITLHSRVHFDVGFPPVRLPGEWEYREETVNLPEGETIAFLPLPTWVGTYDHVLDDDPHAQPVSLPMFYSEAGEAWASFVGRNDVK